jgi:colanic acid/amylovoran biosynthesis glycosyltransferase
LHIAIIVESFPTISETFITNKVLHLCTRGHNVTIFTHRKNSSNALTALYKLDTFTNLTIVKPAIPQTPLQWLSLVTRKPGIFLKAAGSKQGLKSESLNNLLKSTLGNSHFDIIHFEFSALAVLYKDVIPLLKASTVVSCRGTAEKVKPLTTPGRKEQLTELFKKIDSIHCVSADMAQTISAYCDEPGKIFINRPSIDINYFQRSKPYNSFLKITLLSVGRLTFQKSYLTGLLAVKQLKRHNINFQWLIVGDGPQMEEVIYHIHTLGLQENVKLLGKKNKEEILELYNDADIFLLSSVYEGIANVVLEAMAMEIPVVSTKSGGLEEVIEHEVNGLLAEVYDHEALAKQLLVLCSDDALRKRLGEQGRIKIKKQFTIERQINEFEAVYTKLVKQQKTLVEK